MRSLRVLAPAVAVVAALTLASCGSKSDGSVSAGDSPSSKASAKEKTFPIEVQFDPPQAVEAVGPIGQLATASNATPEEFAEQILKAGEVNGIADGFSSNFVIPEELKIHVVSGDEGPNYNPETKTLTLSYGFAILTGNIIATSQPDISESELGKQWAAVNDFILIHEMAHAFIDVLEIPVTGREEDAADGLATFFFTDAVGEAGAEYAFAAATFFAALQNVQGEPDATQYADEHSLSIQRAGDIACKVAGSSEENMQIVAQIGGGLLTEARLPRCPAEYKQMSNAWKALLKPHLANADD